MTRIKIHNFKLNDLDRIYTLSRMLAHFFPDPEQFVTGIYELLLNAVEHGNLGFGFETKTMLIREGKWHEELTRRLASPDYVEKEVDITLSHDDHECRLTIADQGDGFAWQNFLGRVTEDRRPNGRGLWIVLNSRFDDIIFNATGNEVTCVAQYNRSLSNAA